MLLRHVFVLLIFRSKVFRAVSDTMVYVCCICCARIGTPSGLWQSWVKVDGNLKVVEDPANARTSVSRAFQSRILQSPCVLYEDYKDMDARWIRICPACGGTSWWPPWRQYL
jgi:hypothetical protein